ncbi:unnamed protein product [Darwinula stevensoni]|uniref:Ribosome biogenesis protein SLX9 n=1 Tax=Darwinula stevensoni TaxID=69355 RepID=A0A7R9A198_9CRUS|nr:unnamed protein product [Darwinula stevensoni]CAG0883016.1 unnamed protein product [Darwinula stevensoni]
MKARKGASRAKVARAPKSKVAVGGVGKPAKRKIASKAPLRWDESQRGKSDAKAMELLSLVKSGAVKKKTKLKFKKTLLKARITAIKDAEKTKRDALRRRMTPVVGDMEVLKCALPPPTEPSQDPPAKPQKKRQSLRSNQKQMLEDFAQFQAVLSFPPYRADPAEAIKTHVRNTVEAMVEAAVSDR